MKRRKVKKDKPTEKTPQEKRDERKKRIVDKQKLSPLDKRRKKSAYQLYYSRFDPDNPEDNPKRTLEETLLDNYYNDQLYKKKVSKERRLRKPGIQKYWYIKPNLYLITKYPLMFHIISWAWEAGVRKAEKDHKGNEQYPILFNTNARRLSEDLNISREKARQAIARLNNLSIWQSIGNTKTKFKRRLETFQIGEHKRIWIDDNYKFENISNFRLRSNKHKPKTIIDDWAEKEIEILKREQKERKRINKNKVEKKKLKRMYDNL